MTKEDQSKVLEKLNHLFDAISKDLEIIKLNLEDTKESLTKMVNKQEFVSLDPPTTFY